MNLGSAEVHLEVMYWRKSNQIHKWFVENVQDGVDNCAYYYVSMDDLKKLYDLINETLKTKNSKKLPTQEGFFFGNTDIDEYYWHDLKETKQELKAILDNPDFENDSFLYHSSW